jgi:hypothetical protein
VDADAVIREMEKAQMEMPDIKRAVIVPRSDILYLHSLINSAKILRSTNMMTPEMMIVATKEPTERLEQAMHTACDQLKGSYSYTKKPFEGKLLPNTLPLKADITGEFVCKDLFRGFTTQVSIIKNSSTLSNPGLANMTNGVTSAVVELLAIRLPGRPVVQGSQVQQLYERAFITSNMEAIINRDVGKRTKKKTGAHYNDIKASDVEEAAKALGLKLPTKPTTDAAPQAATAPGDTTRPPVDHSAPGTVTIEGK